MPDHSSTRAAGRSRLYVWRCEACAINNHLLKCSTCGADRPNEDEKRGGWDHCTAHSPDGEQCILGAGHSGAHQRTQCNGTCPNASDLCDRCEFQSSALPGAGALPEEPTDCVVCPDCGALLRHVGGEDWACSRCRDPQTESGQRYWRVVASPPPGARDKITDAMQHDVAEMLRALGLGDHARPASPHDVVQNEILPRLRQWPISRLTDKPLTQENVDALYAMIEELSEASAGQPDASKQPASPISDDTLGIPIRPRTGCSTPPVERAPEVVGNLYQHANDLQATAERYQQALEAVRPLVAKYGYGPKSGRADYSVLIPGDEFDALRKALEACDAT